jgi:putative methionine-R-sulfoxide reductase with GAF domain
VEGGAKRIEQLLEGAVQSLSARLGQVEVGGLQRFGDALRHVAHSGSLRLIYEVPREEGGVVWRAATTGLAQLVEDVRSDPDYLTSDARVLSEIAYPIVRAGEVVAVLDVEFPGRIFTSEEAEAVRAEAARVEAALAGYES